MFIEQLLELDIGSFFIGDLVFGMLGTFGTNCRTVCLCFQDGISHGNNN